jgi:hypothetical protein
MRPVVFALLLSACGGSSGLPATTLTLHTTFGSPAPNSSGVSVATADLHLVSVVAVSDRSSSDARAQVPLIDLAMAGASDNRLTGVAPALYSGLSFALGDSDSAGVEINGAFGTEKLHASLSAPSVYVSCDAPLSLGPGGTVQLSLALDPTHWFEGLDLSKVMADADDNGINLSSDDNADVAALVLAHVLEAFKLGCSAG